MEPDKSITAYEVPKRIASYDADMDVMHPNRHRMVQVALDLLPFDRDRPLLVLDLGVGTGFFSERLLKKYPNARVIAIDGAHAMIEVASERLGVDASRVDFRIGDFRDLDRLLADDESGDVVISAYALHHLDAADKAAVVRRCVDFLQPGGWFFNADNIVGETPDLEGRFQELRVAGIVDRAEPSDDRFGGPRRTRTFLDAMEAKEGDQPLRLAEDLEILRASGLKTSSVFWLETREAVTGGFK